MNDITAYEGVMQTVQKESSLIEAFTKPEIINKVYLFAPPEIQKWEDDKKEQFIRKTMMTIAHDEKLKPCFDSEQGKMSLMTAVTKCCSTGLEIGGKHAYLIPQGNYIKRQGQADLKITEARFSIRAGGYYALLCGGARPIFKDLRWGRVFEEDVKLNERLNTELLKAGKNYKAVVNPATGEIFHNVAAVADPGALVGMWTQIIKNNEQKEARFFPKKEIDHYKSYSKQQAKAWTTDYEAMAEQACLRHTCDKYEQARDLLVASIYDNENEDYQDDNKSGFEEIDKMINDEKELNEDPNGF